MSFFEKMSEKIVPVFSVCETGHFFDMRTKGAGKVLKIIKQALDAAYKPNCFIMTKHTRSLRDN